MAVKKRRGERERRRVMVKVFCCLFGFSGSYHIPKGKEGVKLTRLPRKILTPSSFFPRKFS